MKRKLMILTLLCLLMAALAVCVSAETVKSGSCGENITWTLDDAGTLTLTGTGEMDSYDYGEVPWHNEKEQIKKLVVSDGITALTEEAFTSCLNLDIVELGEDISCLQRNQFAGCVYLRCITIPASLHTINDDVFWRCDNLKHIIYTGTREQWEEIEGLGDNPAIEKASVCFGKDVTIRQVEGCSVVRLECSSCGFLELDVKETASHSFANGVCTNCGVEAVWNYCILEDGTVLLKKYSGFDTDVVIPATIEKLPVTMLLGTFSGWHLLTSVTIPESVTVIDDDTFGGCENLTAVNLPSGLEKIGYGAFRYCSRLEKINLPEGLKVIDNYAFYKTSLGSVEIPDSVESIGMGAFEDTKLRSVEWPANVSVVPANVFADCRASR